MCCGERYEKERKKPRRLSEYNRNVAIKFAKTTMKCPRSSNIVYVLHGNMTLKEKEALIVCGECSFNHGEREGRRLADNNSKVLKKY